MLNEREYIEAIASIVTPAGSEAFLEICEEPWSGPCLLMSNFCGAQEPPAEALEGFGRTGALANK